MVWMAMARTPAIGPRPKAMTKISANTISGTVRQNSSRRLTTMRSHGAGAVFSAARKFSAKRQHRARQRADIADQDGLAQIERPFTPAPEPFAEIGPDPVAVLEREDPVEIADEIAEIGEERPQVHLGPDRGDEESRKEHRGPQRDAQTLARHRLAIGRVERGQLLAGENADGDGHACFGSGDRANKRAGSRDPAQFSCPFDQDAFLRRLSTNLISSMVLL